LQLSDGGAITAGDKFVVLSNPKKIVTYFNKHGLLFEDVEDVMSRYNFMRGSRSSPKSS
jgi:hypothetical protein